MTTTSLRSAAGVQSKPRSLNPFQNGYTTTLFVLTVALLTVFPICSYAVFGLGTDRTATSNALSIAYCILMTGLLVAPWLPFSALQSDTTYRRLERMMYVWILVFSLTAVLWEIPWLLMWERIATARDELWAYTWWAYIDGGDFRYVNPDWMVFYIEGWADINGILSLIALGAWLRSGKTKVLPIYYLMFVAAVHLVNTLLYLVSEIATGFPHVDVHSFVNLYVKFFWSNGFWLVMPFFVLAWGKLTLERVYRERYSTASESAGLRGV